MHSVFPCFVILHLRLSLLAAIMIWLHLWHSWPWQKASPLCGPPQGLGSLWDATPPAPLNGAQGLRGRRKASPAQPMENVVVIKDDINPVSTLTSDISLPPLSVDLPVRVSSLQPGSQPGSQRYINGSQARESVVQRVERMC